MNELYIREMNSYGTKGTRGNLLGIEPYLLSEDFASAENFQRKLEGYLRAAQEKGWLTKRTVVLWPEYIGTMLFACGEAPSPSLAGLIQNIRQRHPEFDRYFQSATEQEKTYAALIRTKAPVMADAYRGVFSRLAKKFSATTVAGSIALPSPQLQRGKLSLDLNGPIYNIGMVFDPKGETYPDIVYKAYPTAAELVFTAPAPVGNLPAFDTPIGRLGVLICADSWFPMAYLRMKELNVEIVAVPSFGHGGLPAWTQPWKGYDGWQNPPDVDPKDVNAITNSDAWLKYSLIGRIRESKAAYGINVFLHGNLWPDLDAGGGVAAVVRKRTLWKRENKTEYAALNNLWL
jgi:predicted amidohydrolase